MSESGFKFSSYLVSKGLRRGKGVAYTYSVFYFVSVSRLQQKESGSHHKFKRNGSYKHVIMCTNNEAYRKSSINAFNY